MAGPVPVVLMIARCISATTIRGLGKNKIYYSQILEVTQHICGHPARPQIESAAWGSAFIVVKGGVPRVLWVHYW